MKKLNLKFLIKEIVYKCEININECEIEKNLFDIFLYIYIDDKLFAEFLIIDEYEEYEKFLKKLKNEYLLKIPINLKQEDLICIFKKVAEIIRDKYLQPQDYDYYIELYKNQVSEKFSKKEFQDKIKRDKIKVISENHLVELKEEDQKIRYELIRYFEAIPIGSQRLYLHYNMLNNINFLVSEDIYIGIINYLKNKGYSNYILKEDIIKTINRRKIRFIKENCIPIDIEFANNIKNVLIYDITELLNKKYERGTKEDLKQIKQHCENLLNLKIDKKVLFKNIIKKD